MDSQIHQIIAITCYFEIVQNSYFLISFAKTDYILGRFAILLFLKFVSEFSAQDSGLVMWRSRMQILHLATS